MRFQALPGTTSECAHDFARVTKVADSSDGRTICVGISKLLDVDIQTVQRWFSDFSFPKGENLLRFRFFLGLVGYSITETQGLPDSVRALGDLISLRVVPIQDVATRIETTVDTLLDTLLARAGVSSKRSEAFQAIVDEFSEKTSGQQRKWKEKIHSLGLSEMAPEVLLEPAIIQLDADKLTDEKVIESLAHLILAAKPLAERAVSDSFSADDRRRLRQLTATGCSNAVFELSNLLNRLCGERARNELK